MKLARINPEKPLRQDCLDNMGAKELHRLLRQWNADRNIGEFNDQFRQWIFCIEKRYKKKIADIFQVGMHKVELAFYGMFFTAIKYQGAYLIGKNATPVSISCSRYCELLLLEERLGSKNVRKSIVNNYYGHDYVRAIETRKNNETPFNWDPTLKKLETVFEELDNEMYHKFFC